MSSTKTKKRRTAKNPESQNAETATPVETPQDAGKPEEAKPNKAREGKRILSVAIPDRLFRQLRLLCATSGVPAQRIVESALRRAVHKQLGAALAEIKSDVEG